jgi:putative phosphoesterase
MKIVVISDTHGDLSALNRVAMIENNADVYLHCGDSVVDPSSLSPFVSVKGNCDGGFPDLPFRYETMTPFGKLHMEHYPIYSSMMMKMMYQDGIRIFLHGHTHEREEEMLEGVHIYNPGSLVYPHDSDEGTYLILDIDEKGIKATFKTLSN